MKNTDTYGDECGGGEWVRTGARILTMNNIILFTIFVMQQPVFECIQISLFFLSEVPPDSSYILAQYFGH